MQAARRWPPRMASTACASLKRHMPNGRRCQPDGATKSCPASTYAKAAHFLAYPAKPRAILTPALRAPVKPAGLASGTPSGFPRAPPGFTPMLRSGVAPIVGRHQQNCGAGSLDCLDDSAAVAPSLIAMVLARLHGTAPQAKGGAR